MTEVIHRLTELLKTTPLRKPPLFDRDTLLEHERLREERRQKQEIKEQVINEITVILRKYQNILPFLENNHEQTFNILDTIHLVIVKTKQRLEILQTTRPHEKDLFYSSRSLLNPNNSNKDISVFSDPLQEQVMMFLPIGYGSDELRQKPTYELKKLFVDLKKIEPALEHLITSFITEFENYRADLNQKMIAINKILASYKRLTPIKIVGQNKWLYFHSNSNRTFIQILNSPTESRILNSFYYPIDKIEFDMEIVSDSVLGAGYIHSTDISRIKQDIDSAKLTVDDAPQERSKYGIKTNFVPGQLSNQTYQPVAEALDMILNLSLEPI